MYCNETNVSWMRQHWIATPPAIANEPPHEYVPACSRCLEAIRTVEDIKTVVGVDDIPF